MHLSGRARLCQFDRQSKWIVHNYPIKMHRTTNATRSRALVRSQPIKTKLSRLKSKVNNNEICNAKRWILPPTCCLRVNTCANWSQWCNQPAKQTQLKDAQVHDDLEYWVYCFLSFHSLKILNGENIWIKKTWNGQRWAG